MNFVGGELSIDDVTLRRKPSATGWCVKEIVGHMLETDLLFQRRVSMMLEAQGAADITTRCRRGSSTRGRAESLGLVRGLSAEDWTRRALNRAWGQYTSVSLPNLGIWLANHDQGHLAQIRRARA